MEARDIQTSEIKGSLCRMRLGSYYGRTVESLVKPCGKRGGGRKKIDFFVRISHCWF